MRRGKDEEKSIGPMFPRLHVKDAVKGGPRGPPRNKMALYEQLTIPSNRFNSGVRPGNTVTITNTVASPSASQGTSRERSMYFPSQQTSVPPSHSTERVTTHFSAVNSRLSAPQAAQKKNPSDDVDFMVPVFSQQGKEQCNRSIPGVLNKLCTDSNTRIDMNESCGPSSRRNEQEQDKDEATCIISDSVQVTENATGRTRGDKSGSAFEACAINHGGQDNDEMIELNNVGTQEGNVGNASSSAISKKSEGLMPCRLEHTSGVGEGNKISHEMNSTTLSKRKPIYFTLPENKLIGAADDISETAVGDPVIDIDITPDDVVATIGLKQFWKARRAIANQQRVFAIQVFELHRLIKVQRLIAESPELLLKGNAFISRPALEIGPTPQLKKHRTEHAIKPAAALTLTMHNEVSPSSNQYKIKSSTVDTVIPHKEPSTAPSSQTVSTQPLTHPSFPANSALVSTPPSFPANSPLVSTQPPIPASDMKMFPTPWPFPQTANQQWLVPVMSPSEGLIYKPYPAHALPGSVCGGCGPTPMMGGPTPMMGNPFIQQPCVIPPSSHHHHHSPEGMGTNPTPHGHVLPYMGHNYFPPFKMPAMISQIGSGSAVDQMNYPFSGSNLNGDAGHTLSGTINPGTQRGSCNDAGRRRQRDLLGSTASSPSEKVGVAGPNTVTLPAEERGTPRQNALNLFPTTPPASAGSEGGGAREEVGRVTQVIRVVPHNARTAPESVARIFQCIQEERRQ